MQQDPEHREAVSWGRRKQEHGQERVSSSQLPQAGAGGSHPIPEAVGSSAPLALQSSPLGWIPWLRALSLGESWGARGALLPTASAPSLGAALNPLSHHPAGKACPEHTAT